MWKTDMCCASFSSSVNVLLGLQIGHWINFRLFGSVGWGTRGSVWPTSAITWSLAMIVASRFAVVALAEKVTSSSSENRIPQSWSDLGEIISSFSTEGPVKGPEMGLRLQVKAAQRELVASKKFVWQKIRHREKRHSINFRPIFLKRIERGRTLLGSQTHKQVRQGNYLTI